MAKAIHTDADNMRARTHKTRHGRQEVFQCLQSKSVGTMRPTKNAHSAEWLPITSGSLAEYRSHSARTIFVMSA